MSNRAYVSLAWGARYQPLLARLIQSLRDVGDPTPVVSWTNSLPPGTPEGDARFIAYRAKPFAMLAAVEMGYDSIIWLDAASYAVLHGVEIFGHVEHFGWWLVNNGWKFGNWVSDKALERFGMTRDQAMGITEISTMGLGLYMGCPRSMNFLNQWAEYARNGAFDGAHANSAAMDEIRRMGLPTRTVDHLSDDVRCYGHRHDQSAATWTAHQLGMELTPRPKFIDYYSPDKEPDPRTVFLNRGGL